MISNGYRSGFTRLELMVLLAALIGVAAAVIFNRVYGGPYRNWIDIALIVAAIACFTVACRAWAGKWKACRAGKERRRREARTAAIAEEERRKKEQQRQVWRKSRIDKAKSAVDRLTEQWRRAENLTEEAELLPAHGETPEEADIRDVMAKTVADLAGQEDFIVAMQQAASGLEEIPDDAALSAAVSEVKGDAERRRRRIQRDADVLQESIGTVKILRERKKAEALRVAGVIHCLACGFGYPLSNFCPHCGVRSPEKLTCARCGETYMLPVHWLGDAEKTEPLHCMACGHPHEGI